MQEAQQIEFLGAANPEKTAVSLTLFSKTPLDRATFLLALREFLDNAEFDIEMVPERLDFPHNTAEQ